MRKSGKCPFQEDLNQVAQSLAGRLGLRVAYRAGDVASGGKHSELYLGFAAPDKSWHLTEPQFCVPLFLDISVLIPHSLQLT